MHALTAVFQQAAATGIGVYFASGDDGDNADLVGHRSVGFPDSSPLVTSVGGTSLGIGRWGQRPWETGWGTTDLELDAGAWRRTDRSATSSTAAAAGSATSSPSPPTRPAWCRPGSPTGRATRCGPSPTSRWWPTRRPAPSSRESYATHDGGTRIVDSWIGGTSLAAPLMAGIAALADQQWHRPRGFLNPRLYGLAGSCALHDIRALGRHPGGAAQRPRASTAT